MSTSKFMLKNLLYAIITVSAALLIFCGCFDQGYIQITAEEAKQMIDENTVIIVDVREPHEYAESHIEGAILLPLSQIHSLAKSAIPDKNATLLVYCRTGRRSKEGAAALVDMGYKNVYEFGGILDWPYGVVN